MFLKLYIFLLYNLTLYPQYILKIITKLSNSFLQLITVNISKPPSRPDGDSRYGGTPVN